MEEKKKRKSAAQVEEEHLEELFFGDVERHIPGIGGGGGGGGLCAKHTEFFANVNQLLHRHEDRDVVPGSGSGSGSGSGFAGYEDDIHSLFSQTLRSSSSGGSCSSGISIAERLFLKYIVTIVECYLIAEAKRSNHEYFIRYLYVLLETLIVNVRQLELIGLDMALFYHRIQNIREDRLSAAEPADAAAVHRQKQNRDKYMMNFEMIQQCLELFRTYRNRGVYVKDLFDVRNSYTQKQQQFPSNSSQTPQQPYSDPSENIYSLANVFGEYQDYFLFDFLPPPPPAPAPTTDRSRSSNDDKVMMFISNKEYMKMLNHMKLHDEFAFAENRKYTLTSSSSSPFGGGGKTLKTVKCNLFEFYFKKNRAVRPMKIIY